MTPRNRIVLDEGDEVSIIEFTVNSHGTLVARQEDARS